MSKNADSRDRSRKGRVVRLMAGFLAGIVVVGMTAWGAGALYYSLILPDPLLRAVLAGGFVVTTILAFLLLPRRRRALMGFFVVFAILVALFFQIPASNDRDWQPEVAKTPWAEINGDLVTIHDVRNFDYRTETDYDARWYRTGKSVDRPRRR